MTIRCLGVIPARFPSTRLLGKPLKEIEGKTLLQRVWEQASKAKRVSQLIIATDSEEIAKHARSFGAEVMLTSDKHLTGSDRVCEVTEHFETLGQHFSLIANIQGDMPFINPDVIDLTIDILAKADPEFGMSTIATPILSEEEFSRPSAVKVVLGMDNSALYFSRAAIPFWRERSEIKISEVEPCGYKHMGLYVFRPAALKRIHQLPQFLAEKREKLEQLRALGGGIRIKVALASTEMVYPSIEVDTPEDLERARAHCRKSEINGPPISAHS